MERLEFDCFPYYDQGKTNNNKRIECAEKRD